MTEIEMTEFAMTEIEMLAAQLRALTAAVDGLTARIDALPLAPDHDVDLRSDGRESGTSDPSSCHQMAGKVVVGAGNSAIADRNVFADRNAVPDAFAWPSEEELGRYLASTGRIPGARP